MQRYFSSVNYSSEKEMFLDMNRYIRELEDKNQKLEKRLERMTKLASSLQEKLGKNV